MSETTDKFDHIEALILADMKKRRDTLDRAIQRMEAELKERLPKK